jgi:hypothetical protein
MTKVAAPTAPAGHFTKQQFRIDLDQHTVTCPARLSVPIIMARQGGGVARFGRACQVCPLQASSTSSLAGRTITIHPHEPRLQAARGRQRDPAWRADYRAHRPTVERSSPTCCAAATVADEPVCGAGCVCRAGRSLKTWRVAGRCRLTQDQGGREPDHPSLVRSPPSTTRPQGPNLTVARKAHRTPGT